MIWKDAFIRETIFHSRTLLVSNNERIWKAGLSSACLPQLEGIEITIAIPWALLYFLLLVDHKYLSLFDYVSARSGWALKRLRFFDKDENINM